MWGSSSMYPLFTTGAIDVNTNLLYGLIIGIFFGFILERVGFGNSKVIAAIFHFKDLRVSQTMISAIITAATWIVIASYFGWVDYSKMFIPLVYVWPYLVGGIIFGAGMAMAGWCPGTAVVGFASGKIDAAVFMLGMLSGMYVYFIEFDKISSFANSGYIGRYTIDNLIGGNMYTTSYLVTIIMGIGLGVFMNYMKSIVNKNEGK
ncbi:MAG: DUF6691 family protein [Sulfurospirillaceae bacterium]|nr:DUF6691 family protein [Sulfurospirillaceae bacterium]